MKPERHSDSAANQVIVRRQPLAEGPHPSLCLTQRLLGSELLDGFALSSPALTERRKAQLKILRRCC